MFLTPGEARTLSLKANALPLSYSPLPVIIHVIVFIKRLHPFNAIPNLLYFYPLLIMSCLKKVVQMYSQIGEAAFHDS